ncbi:MAG: Gfo/Idh/MocA family oxidoreductase [Fimbriimonadaceae bacterium]|nr:Gfo/Idh/MocA family oxidoreductase [Fimbriimonadaceae bacterium]
MESLKWAILGTGSISKKFAQGLKLSRTGSIACAGSRNGETAEAFCAEFGGRPGDYEAAVQDPEVQAVYIGLPHSLHEEWTIRSAQAGKAVLCEKPFVLTPESADRALAAVDQHGVFFMEAFMYRCHPQARNLRELVRSGRFGRATHVVAEFGFNAPLDWQNFRTVRTEGGGALMDVGVYPITMSMLAADEAPSTGTYRMETAGDGYDGYGEGTLEFPGGMTAEFRTAIHRQLENKVVIHLEGGRVEVDEPWFSRGEVRVFDSEGTLVETQPPIDGDLYAYEADEVAASLSGGESPCFTKQDTRDLIRIIEILKKDAGLSFEPGGA